MPERIQLKRQKGWKLPDNTVSVARPGKFGNPFKVGQRDDWELIESNTQAVTMFRDMLDIEGLREDYGYPSDSEIQKTLKGKNLACWCSITDDCHADVLLAIANGAEQESGK